MCTLWYLHKTGKIEILRYLNKIVDDSVKQARDDNGDTALTLAARYGYDAIVQFLVEEAGLDPVD